SAGSSALPDANLGAAILPYQHDLHTGNTGEGIFTATLGTAPNRQFVIEWRTHYFGRSGTADFEIVLYETTNVVRVVYGSTIDSGGLETTGLQAAAAGPAREFSCNQAVEPSGMRVDNVPQA